jgi:NADH-quinone oxidoreductase subunit C
MNLTVEQLYAAFAPLVGVDPVPPAPVAAPVPVPAATPAPAGAAAPVAPVAPATPPPPPSPLKITDPKLKGYHLDVTVNPDQVVAAAEVVTRFGFAMDTITGVDWMAAGQMEIVYDYFHFTSPLHVVVRARVPRDNPKLPTISKVFPGANWHERETHDFFGIEFTGHPDLSPLLLPEDCTFHPLRKDFAGVA